MSNVTLVTPGGYHVVDVEFGPDHCDSHVVLFAVRQMQWDAA